MFKQLAHAAYRVSNLEASLAFYCNQLGFEEAFRLHHPQTGNLWIVYLQVAPGQFVELFPEERELTAGTRYAHLCIETEDLEGTVAELRRRGVTMMREISRGLDNNLQAWVRDPDGNEVELMQIHPDSPQAQAARAMLAKLK